MAVKIKKFLKPKPEQYYDITLRYSLNSFPKGKSHNRYTAGLLRRLRIPSKNAQEPMKIRNRMSIFINWIPEKEKNRICNRAKRIKDDGIFREVLVYEC